MKHLFRFDDISVNTEPGKLKWMIQFLRRRFKTCEILLAISPATHFILEDGELARERVFPRTLHLEADFRVFYRVNKIGIPDFLDKIGPVKVASHGMIHVDHRLLSRTAQELSILMSCSLLRTSLFVPPFHKWNQKTERVCEEHDIGLLKNSKAWRHLAYRPFDRTHPNYYLHTHDFSYDDFVKRFK